ncbi:MAG: DUF4296 domain-containing protein [Crocinitomicaceae bacterium]
MRKFFFVLVFFLANCSDGAFSSNDPYIEEDKFVEVYEEILVLENYYQTKYGVPKTYKAALDKSCQKVFVKHNVSKQDFEKTFDYYAHTPEKLKSINERVIARLNKKKL